MADNTVQRSGTDIAQILKLAELAGGTQYGAKHGLNSKEVADTARNALNDALLKIPEGLRDGIGKVAQRIAEKASMHAAANHIAGVKELSMDEAANLGVKENSGILRNLFSLVRSPRMPKNLFLEGKEAENLASMAEQHGYQGVQETLKSFTGGVKSPQGLFEETSLSASQAGQAATQASAQATSAASAARQQAEGIKGALGNFFGIVGKMDMTNKAALGVSAVAAVHGASKIVQRDEQGKRRICMRNVLYTGVALAAGAATVYGHQKGGNTIDGTLAAGKQIVGKFTEMLANRGAAGVGQTRS